MELTLIVAGLLAAVAGLAIAVACALRAVAVHRHDLAAAGMRPAVRLSGGSRRMRAAGRPDLVPPRARWFFSRSRLSSPLAAAVP